MNDHIPSLQAQIHQYLSALIQEADFPCAKLQAAVRYSLLAPGKCFRPMLVYLSADILSLPMVVCDAIAAAIEMTHCYSLIHDDLPAMDNDDFRRGRPSNHRAFDEATAILAGDTLANWAIAHLQKRLPKYIGAEKTLAVIAVLLDASGPWGMVGGQSLDLQMEAEVRPALAHIQQVHVLKTGALILACVKMVVAAKGSEDSVKAQALIQFAQHLGLAFQMQDDYMDRFLDAKHLGKAHSSDTYNHKFTYADAIEQDGLASAVTQQFDKACDALQPCGESANALKGLTSTLLQRMGHQDKGKRNENT